MRKVAKLFRRRRVFKRLADQAKYPRTRRFYAQELYHCEEDIARHLKRMVFGVNILVLAAILFCSGCQTASGLGRDITSVSDGFMEQNAKNR